MITNTALNHSRDRENGKEREKEKEKDKKEKSLLGLTTFMSGALKRMYDINQKTEFIALNAAIEGVRSQNQSENFTLVAKAVSKQAQRASEVAKKLEQEIHELQIKALKATAVRFADISSDVIDKIDRNLFERNCDCQAWASFEETVACVTATQDMESAKDFVNHPNGTHIREITSSCCELLETLAKIYEVYTEILVLNNRGLIVAATNPSMVEENLGEKEFFRECMSSGEVFVSEMFYSPFCRGYVVAFSSPILDEKGNVMGVLSTRFNWDFVEDILKKVPLPLDTKIYVVTQEGTVISSTSKKGILKDNLSWLMAGEAATEGESGYSIECSRNGRLGAYGFCHSKGFANYKGKNWSVIVGHPLELEKAYFLLERILKDENTGGLKLSAADIANKELEDVTKIINDYVEQINSINNETNILAINAAIQAGVAGVEGESFAVIATEISKLAKQSEEFVHIVNSLTSDLGNSVHNTVATRLGDAAYDTIDKIDRNLFERYCDIQAFSCFQKIVSGASSGKSGKEIQELLKKLHKIYEVYHDILLLDVDGKILSTAIHKELIGSNQSDRDWFRHALQGKIYVSDLYYSQSIHAHTVTFAAPVFKENGEVCGVLSTRFNFHYVNDIMKSAIVGKNSQVYLVNAKGTVIGAPDGEGVLKDSFARLKAFKCLSEHPFGFVFENIEGEDYAVGHARYCGYNKYKGLGWNVMIKRPVQEVPE